MKCSELALVIEQLRPDADAREVARLCLLLSNSTNDLAEFANLETLHDAWRTVDIRMQAATDQHCAMTDELESLSQSSPQEFAAEQVWVLVRAIKVQSQILEMYVGESKAEALEE